MYYVSPTWSGSGATIARPKRIDDDRRICCWIICVAFIVTRRTGDEPVVRIPFAKMKLAAFVEPLERTDLEACRLEQIAYSAMRIEDLMVVASGSRPVWLHVIDVSGIGVKPVGNRNPKVATGPK